MDDLTKFRRKIGDKVKADKDVATGNGSTTQWHLRHENVFDLQVFIGTTLQVIGTNYTLDSSSGAVDFIAAPADEQRVTFIYKFACFTDEEAQQLITEYGLDGAVIEALREILADSSRLMNYKQGETEVEYSVVFKQTKELLEYYENKMLSAIDDADAFFAIGSRQTQQDDPTWRPNDISRWDSIG